MFDKYIKLKNYSRIAMLISLIVLAIIVAVLLMFYLGEFDWLILAVFPILFTGLFLIFHLILYVFADLKLILLAKDE